MADIINLNKRSIIKKAKAISEATNTTSNKTDKYHKSLAKQLIKDDPEKVAAIASVGLDLDTASEWTATIAEMQTIIYEAVYEAHKKSGFNVQFATLVTISLAQTAADELTALGMCSELSRQVFSNLKEATVGVIKEVEQISADEYMNENYPTACFEEDEETDPT